MAFLTPNLILTIIHTLYLSQQFPWFKSGNGIKNDFFQHYGFWLIKQKLCIFGPRVYPLGSLVIALVRVSVRVCVCVSVFKYLRDRSLVFSEILHEVAGQ